MIAALHVVVPAHDEEALLGRCLDSVCAALDLFGATHPGVATSVTVVLDSCTDRSAAVCALRNVQTLVIDARAVGIARAAGFDRAVDAWRHLDPAEVWMLSTDADTHVPLTWVSEHHAAASAGADMVVGAVRPDPSDLHPRVLAVWRHRHQSTGGHVHGANLGVRLSAYLSVGGFAGVAAHEDVGLADRIRATGVPWTAVTTVTTSARELGRAPGGFAGYIRALNSEVLLPGSEQPDPFRSRRRDSVRRALLRETSRAPRR